MPAPDLTIAILNHHLRGWPEDCIESLAPLAAGTELLLVQAESAPRVAGTRLIPVPPDASRAAAKNLAVAEAQGVHLLLATADTVARDGTVERLRRFLEEIESAPDPKHAPVVSAQLLQENGMPRRTGYALPSIAREINFIEWLWRQRHLSIRPRKPPVTGPPRQAVALHSTFLMARRETFRAVGEFAEGYRFAFEDLEWSWRARRKDVELWVCPAAPAYKLAPQLRGRLSPEIRLVMEASQRRCVRETRGAGYARLFGTTRAAKSLALWLGAAGLDSVLCGNSPLLANQAAVHCALFRLRPDSPLPEGGLPPDIESCVRWEAFV